MSRSKGEAGKITSERQACGGELWPEECWYTHTFFRAGVLVYARSSNGVVQAGRPKLRQMWKW
ncbi:hypothetical protein E2C01_015340 [Portunus trituberculatus]|uniref:Uncharacterized protein n=1 Tax=Portunus trituberculatus TaxID=210409 RepID=A0A5B7DML2_PORTR|nr:hypothetical protein [Portunus trituberculatus]